MQSVKIVPNPLEIIITLGCWRIYPTRAPIIVTRKKYAITDTYVCGKTAVQRSMNRIP